MSNKMPRVKITVLNRMFNADLAREYMNVDEGYGLCEQFHEGQEFFADAPWSPPPGFCTWAWADLRPDIQTIMTGGNLPWMKQRGVAIASCTDVFRPVICKIERVE